MNFVKKTVLGFLMGICGLIVSQNGFCVEVEEKAPLLQKSCDSGTFAACHNLGGMYALGQGVKQDNVKAVKLFEKACEGGLLISCSGLAGLYFEGKSVRQDHVKAAALLQKACEGGVKQGCDVLKARSVPVARR